jgi:hypothetical protein
MAAAPGAGRAIVPRGDHAHAGVLLAGARRGRHRAAMGYSLRMLYRYRAIRTP